MSARGAPTPHMVEWPAVTRDYASACLRVDGFDVTYLAAGEGPETVVLLHGFGAWSEVVWSQLIPALSDRYRVVAPDLLGFGLSAKPGPDHFNGEDPLEPEVRFLESFLDQLGVKRASLVGSSFGGGLAIRYAADHPQIVDKLVLVSSMGLGRSIHPVYKAIALPVLGEALVKPSKMRIRMMWESIVNDSSLVTDAIVERNHEILSQPGAAEIFAAARLGVNLVGQKILLDDSLERIAQPSLVVWGKRDRIIPVRHARRAVRKLKNGELALLDCGHLPPFECAEAFNPLVRGFLDRPGPGAVAGDAAEEAAS